MYDDVVELRLYLCENGGVLLCDWNFLLLTLLDWIGFTCDLIDSLEICIMR